MQGRIAVAVAVAWAVFMWWRVRHGADFGDGAYVVTLAVRVAQGAQPLSDEMSAHVLGAGPAVPVPWAWLHLVGTEGVVRAVRVGYAVLAGVAGLVAYRALRTAFEPMAAGLAVVAALLPTATGCSSSATTRCRRCCCSWG